MYVVKLRDFMLMKGTPKDFQLLLYAGLLYEWRMGMRTIFVSHQWLSRIHPDPKGEQIQVLRDALGKLMDGSLQLSLDGHMVFHATDDTYIWFDFGVPQITARSDCYDDNIQSDVTKAVQSIPGYVERCDVFVALTPELLNADTGSICNSASWRMRGWCQAEFLCRLLASSKETTTITVHSSMIAELTLVHDWDVVHRSDFTVEADRKTVSDLIKRAVDCKIQSRRIASRIACRHLVANRSRLCHNNRSTASTLEAFLEDYQFVSLQEAVSEAGGFTGLLCAVFSGDVGMIRTLIENKADVEQRCSGLFEIGQVDSHTPLMIAARTDQDPEVLRTLIELRADVNARSKPHGLLVASWVKSPGQVKVLAESKADLNGLNALGCSPLTVASALVDTETLAELIACGCSVNVSQTFTPLMAVSNVSKMHAAEKARLLIAHQADLNAQASPMGMFGCACRLAQFMFRFSDFSTASAATKFFGSIEGLTPLGFASFFGDLALVNCLLEADADPSIRNSRQDRPEDIARAQGNLLVADALTSCCFSL